MREIIPPGHRRYDSGRVKQRVKATSVLPKDKHQDIWCWRNRFKFTHILLFIYYKVWLVFALYLKVYFVLEKQLSSHQATLMRWEAPHRTFHDSWTSFINIHLVKLQHAAVWLSFIIPKPVDFSKNVAGRRWGDTSSPSHCDPPSRSSGTLLASELD